MFMCQKWNERKHLSAQAQSSCGSTAITSSLDQTLITDESRSHDTKQLCEIQCEVTEFSEEHKLLGDIN